MHKKGITEEVAKKRSRKNVKIQVGRVSRWTCEEGIFFGWSFGSASVYENWGISPIRETQRHPIHSKLGVWGLGGRVGPYTETAAFPQQIRLDHGQFDR